MSLPASTQQQRSAGLEKAAIARRARVVLRENLKTGRASLAEVLDRSDYDETLARTKILYVLESLPNVGKIKAQRIIDEVGIAPSRRLAGLGERQRTELLQLLG